jgi:chromosomal replication initiator protein
MNHLEQLDTEGKQLATGEPDLGWMLARAITQRIGEPSYNLWFQDRTLFSWEPDTLVIGVPNRFYQEWLQKRFTADVQAAVRDVLGEARAVKFHIDPQLFRAARKAQAEGEDFPTPTAKDKKAKAAKPEPPPEKEAPKKPAPQNQRNTPARGRLWRSLDEFIAGPCNRVAHASALTVAEHPGLEVNPLVLYGPVGTGKSHLLEGIYLEIRKRHADWRVTFVTAEDFTNRFVQAMRLGKLSAFRKQFRECDAFLMDDLHFLAKKQATQEEFLHTFDALHAAGRQVAVTCDCHPRLNDLLMPELTDRLLGGGVWGILPPDFDTRVNLLRAKGIKLGQRALPEEVIGFLAEQMRGNVRELEGAVNGLLHFSKVSGRNIDIPLAREALQELLRYSIRIVQLPDIDRTICEFLSLEAGALQTARRSWAYSHPRMIAMYLARKYTSATYSEIGRYFGNRTHGTVGSAEKKVRSWFKDDTALTLGNRQMRVRDLVERIERDLLG